jgi:hypothetical protein
VARFSLRAAPKTLVERTHLGGDALEQAPVALVECIRARPSRELLVGIPLVAAACAWLLARSRLPLERRVAL